MRRYFYVVIILFAAAAFAVIKFNKRRAELREQVLKEKLAVQEKEIQNEHRAREINSVGSSIAADYRSIFSVDLEHDAGTCYRARNGSGNVESDLEGVKMGDNFSFSEKFLEYANNFVAEADREKFLNFIKPENIRAKLSKEITTGHRYRAIKNGVEQYEMIRLVDTYLGKARDNINFISVGFADVDSETRELMEENRTLAEKMKKI